MSRETDSLKELYIAVADKEMITESQSEEPSHDPRGAADVELEKRVSDAARHDGLTDAVE